MGAGRGLRAGPPRRHRRGHRLGIPGQLKPAAAAHPRSLRQPHRRGRVPPRVAPADGGRDQPRPALAALARRAPRRPRRARGRVLCVVPGRRRARVPRLDDLRGASRPSQPTRAGGSLGAADDIGRKHAVPGICAARLRRRAEAGAREGLGQVRHGDDREAGRLRRPRQHDARRARRRLVAHHGPQVVLLGADV